MRTVALRLDDQTYNKLSNIVTQNGSSIAHELREMIVSFVDDTGALGNTCA
jgi:hypothetical protein